MNVGLQDVRGVTDDLPWGVPKEKALVSVSTRHLTAAKVLKERDLPHDALLQLGLAVECYLKSVYCKARFLVLGRKSPDELKSTNGVWARLVDGPGGRGPFWAESFRHNHRALLEVIRTSVALDAQATAKKAEEELRGAIGSFSQGWAQMRYTDPGDAGDDGSYARLLGAFEAFRGAVEEPDAQEE